jgi:hypothetical protein
MAHRSISSAPARVVWRSSCRIRMERGRRTGGLFFCSEGHDAFAGLEASIDHEAWHQPCVQGANVSERVPHLINRGSGLNLFSNRSHLSPPISKHDSFGIAVLPPRLTRRSPIGMQKGEQAPKSLKPGVIEDIALPSRDTAVQRVVDRQNALGGAKWNGSSRK